MSKKIIGLAAAAFLAACAAQSLIALKKALAAKAQEENAPEEPAEDPAEEPAPEEPEPKEE